MIEIGDPIPSVSLPDQFGNEIALSSFDGPLVIYFYPKDNTKVCTAQACGFRDRYEDFKAYGAEVIGISKDSVKSHEKVAKNRQLPFILLSDSSGEAHRKFGIPSLLFGMVPARITFVVDQAGKVVHTFRADFNAEQHIKESIRILESLQPTHP